MYAIINCGSKQYKVREGEKIKVERLHLEEGQEYVVEDVVLLRDKEGCREGGRVIAEVVRHGRGPKLRFYKFRKRKNYRRKYGHRQPFTELLIKKISYDKSKD